MSRGGLNVRWAAALIEGLTRAGVEQAVLSPGSRCTPITLACEAYLETQVLVDERSAAFYALGLAKATARPVVLVCTSGTAAANWYPAVVEASYGLTPLLLLTADRPPELQGFGANQTIDQVKIFGEFVRAYHGLPPATHSALAAMHTLAARVVDQCCWPLPGPVHINIPLREPLHPAQELALTPSDSPLSGGGLLPLVRNRPTPRSVLHPDPLVLNELMGHVVGKPGLIVCGELPCSTALATAITELAAILECPILADPLSNLRWGPHDRSHILCHYDAWICPAALPALNPQWLIRFGTMPISKRLQQNLAACNQPVQILVDAQGTWSDPQHSATLMVRADVVTFCEQLTQRINSPQPDIWQSTLGALEQSAAAHLANSDIPLEWVITRRLLQRLPANATLLIGNSMPIRDLDACMGTAAKPLRICANRGASGIDGTVSTLAGLAAGSQEVVVGMIGDLTLFHDLTGLHALQGLNLILIVINNGGGGIFRYLPQAQLANFERNWLTPTKLNISQAAVLFNIQHQAVTCSQTFANALDTALSSNGAQLIEVVVDAAASVAQHRAYWSAVTALSSCKS